MPLMRGQCSCGEVKFEFKMPEPLAYQCHCSVCRKASGSAYSTTLMAPTQGFVWLEGQNKVSSYAKKNGYKTAFCSCCGSPVPNLFRDYPLYSVPVGALDDDIKPRVVVQLYLDSKAGWEKDGLEGQQFATMPSIDDMLGFLHIYNP